MMFAMIIPLALLICGVLLGVSKLKFMTKKNSVNVYFSLGINRTTLFSSTYLAGLLQAFIAIFVPMLVIFFINVGYFGYSKELLMSILILAVGYFAMFFFAFTVSSIVTSAVGTASEAIIYSLMLVLLPNIIFFCINELMSLFLLGNEYTLNNNQIIWSLGITPVSLTDKYSYLVPSSFMSENINFYTVLTNKNVVPSAASYDSLNEVVKWIAPNFKASIGWIFASLAGFVLGLLTINKRRAEYAGFIGANQIVNNIAAFIISFAGSCAAAKVLQEFLPRTTSIILAIVAFILIYMLAKIIMIRKVKIFVKDLTKLPIHLCVGLVFCLFFITGLFGYSSKQPNVTDVKSVDISIPAGSSLFFNSSSGSGYDATSSLSEMNGYLDDITSKNDIEQIIKLHKLIIEDGKVSYNKKENPKSKDDAVYGNIYLKYTLKDGKTITRYYEQVRISTLEKMLSIEKTEKYNSLVDSVFTQPISKKDKENILSLKNIIQGTESNIYLLSNNLDIKDPCELTDVQRKKLRECIAEDLKSQSIKDRYFSTSELLGVIGFVGVPQMDKNDGYSQSQVDPNVELVAELTQDNLFSLSGHTYYDNCYYVNITSDMKNTIKFLEDNALLSSFENTTKIVSAEIIDRELYSINYPWTFSYNAGNSYQFIGGRTTKVALNESGKNDYSSFSNSFKITDADTISSLKKNSYYSYYSPMGGYFIRYTLDSGDKTVMFIPDNKVPQNLKDGISKLAEKAKTSQLQNHSY